jgi:hypothetical protein
VIIVEMQTTAINGVISTYSSGLTVNSPTYNRPGSSSGGFYYEAIQVIVFFDGVYSFKSISDTDAYGYLYLNNFNPLRPEDNLIGRDDDSAGSGQFLITSQFTSTNTYVLVFTTYRPDSRAVFSISGLGPARVSFTRIDVLANSTLPTQTTSGIQRTSSTRMQSTFTTTFREYFLEF